MKHIIVISNTSIAMKYIETIEIDKGCINIETTGNSVFEYFDTEEEAKVRYEQLVTDWVFYLSN